LFDGQTVYPVIFGVNDDRDAVVCDGQLDVFDAFLCGERYLARFDRPRCVVDVCLQAQEFREPATGATLSDGYPNPRVLQRELLGYGFCDRVDGARSVDSNGTA